MSREKNSPWYVELFLAFGGWIAGLLAAIAIFAIGVAIVGDFDDDGRDIFISLIAILLGSGFVIAGGAIGGRGSGDFSRHFGISFIAAGLTAAAGGLWYLIFKLLDAASLSEEAAAGGAGLVAALTLAGASYVLTRRMRDGILTFLTTLAVYGVATGALIILRSDQAIGWHTDHYAAALSVAFGSWIFARAPEGSLHRPASAALLIGPVFYYFLMGSADLWREGADLHRNWLIGEAVFIATALSCLWLLRSRYSPAPLTAAALLILAGVWLLPNAGAVAIIILLTAIAANHRGLAIIGIIGLIWFISRYYYDLSMTLLEKSAFLAAMGAATLVGTFLFKRLAREQVERPATSGGARRNIVMALAFAAILAGALGYINRSVLRLETAFADATEIYLPLGPRDPRSLIQGDYMVLNYLREIYPPREEIIALPRDGEVFIQLDDARTASFSRIPINGDQPGPGEIRIDYVKTSNARMRYVPESYFFQEGEAETYQPARFAVVRVTPEGRARLMGLADENYTRLGQDE